MDYLWGTLQGTARQFGAADYSSVGYFLGVVVNIMLGTGIAISVISIILSGIKFVMSKGDPKAFVTAKRTLTYSVVAFVLVAGAFVLKIMILNMLGVTDDAEIRNAVPTF